MFAVILRPQLLTRLGEGLGMRYFRQRLFNQGHTVGHDAELRSWEGI